MSQVFLLSTVVISVMTVFFGLSSAAAFKLSQSQRDGVDLALSILGVLSGIGLVATHPNTTYLSIGIATTLSNGIFCYGPAHRLREAQAGQTAGIPSPQGEALVSDLAKVLPRLALQCEEIGGPDLAAAAALARRAASIDSSAMSSLIEHALFHELWDYISQAIDHADFDPLFASEVDALQAEWEGDGVLAVAALRCGSKAS